MTTTSSLRTIKSTDEHGYTYDELVVEEAGTYQFSVCCYNPLNLEECRERARAIQRAVNTFDEAKAALAICVKALDTSLGAGYMSPDQRENARCQGLEDAKAVLAKMKDV